MAVLPHSFKALNLRTYAARKDIASGDSRGEIFPKLELQKVLSGAKQPPLVSNHQAFITPTT